MFTVWSHDYCEFVSAQIPKSVPLVGGMIVMQSQVRPELRDRVAQFTREQAESIREQLIKETGCEADVRPVGAAE